MQKSNLPYVEYTSNVEEDVMQNVQIEKAASISSAATQQSRAVAKKSTTKRQSNIDNAGHNSTVETNKPSHSIVVSKLDKLC